MAAGKTNISLSQILSLVGRLDDASGDEKPRDFGLSGEVPKGCGRCTSRAQDTHRKTDREPVVGVGIDPSFRGPRRRLGRRLQNVHRLVLPVCIHKAVSKGFGKEIGGHCQVDGAFGLTPEQRRLVKRCDRQKTLSHSPPNRVSSSSSNPTHATGSPHLSARRQ